MFSDSSKKGALCCRGVKTWPICQRFSPGFADAPFLGNPLAKWLSSGGGGREGRLTEAVAHACTPRREPLPVLETWLMDLRVLPLSGRRRSRQLRWLLWPHSGVEASRLALRVNPWRLLIWGDFSRETHTKAVFVVKTLRSSFSLRAIQLDSFFFFFFPKLGKQRRNNCVCFVC